MGTSKSGSSGQTIGFKYYFSILMGLCRGPVDELVLITCGDLLAWDGATDAGQDIPDLLAGGFMARLSAVTYAPPTDGGGQWSGLIGLSANTEGVPISKGELFGGDAKEGGLVGQFDMQMGAADQVLGSRIKTIMAGLRLSAMRGVATLFYDGQIISNNPYPKAFKFRVRRALRGWDGEPWYPERAIIKLSDPAIPGYDRSTSSGHTYGVFSSVDGSTTTVDTAVDGSQTMTTYNPATGLTTSTAVPMEYNDIRAMNPAHIIYECCTNRDWGRGLDRALMDEASFTSAANTLYDEGFGLCLKWSRADDIDTFVQSVINHIGGMLYTDKITGLFCLRLIRGDYSASALSVFDYNTGLIDVTLAETGATDTSANEIIVKYNSPVLNVDKEARVQNIASINSTGSVFSMTKQYPGIPTSDLALRVAQRDLKAMSGGMKRVTVVLDRRGYQIVPGDVIKVNALDRKLPNIILRVATIEDTSENDGKITIQAAQDTFGLPLVPMIEPQGSTWQEPNMYPVPIIDQFGMEASYRDIYHFAGSAVERDLEGTSSFVTMVARAPNSGAYAFDVQESVAHVGTTHSSDWEQVGSGTFIKLSKLAVAIGQSDRLLTVRGDFTTSNVTVGMCLLISDSNIWTYKEEYVRLDAIRDNMDGTMTLTVGRGCVDTPPQKYRAGAWVWAWDQGGIVDPKEYVKNDYVGLRGLTKTSRGILRANRARNINIPILYRHLRPYPVANLKAAGFTTDLVPEFLGPDIDFTWDHRNRLTEADILVDQLAGDIAPEPGTSYYVFIIGTNAVGQIHGFPLVSSTSFVGKSATMTGAIADAQGFTDGPMSVIVYVRRVDTVGGLPEQDLKQARVDFHYSRSGAGPAIPGPMPDFGWGVDFGDNYGGSTP